MLRIGSKGDLDNPPIMGAFVVAEGFDYHVSGEIPAPNPQYSCRRPELLAATIRSFQLNPDEWR